jgi:hypothetical protein
VTHTNAEGALTTESPSRTKVEGEEVAEATTTDAAVEETKGEEETYPEEVKEEREPDVDDQYKTSQTLEDYLASKKKTTARKEVRVVEETKKANLEKNESTKLKTETIVN